MSRSFLPSFFRWALALPDSEPVRLLHALAREVFRALGGEAIEEHLAAYAELVTLWRAGGPDRPPLREAMRAMGARERGLAKLEKLREQAWLQARVEVFQRTGARIPLPMTPETADRLQDAQTAQAMRDLSAQIQQVGAPARDLEGTRPGAVATTQPNAANHAVNHAVNHAAGQPDPNVPNRPLTNLEIKQGIRQLIEAQVNRKQVEALRAEAQSGRLTRAEFFGRVVNLLEQRQVA